MLLFASKARPSAPWLHHALLHTQAADLDKARSNITPNERLLKEAEGQLQETQVGAMLFSAFVSFLEFVWPADSQAGGL